MVARYDSNEKKKLKSCCNKIQLRFTSKIAAAAVRHAADYSKFPTATGKDDDERPRSTKINFKVSSDFQRKT